MHITKKIIASAVLALGLCASAFAQSSANPLSVSYAGDPSILNNFNVEQPSVYAIGTHVFFTVRGEPSSRALVTIQTQRGVKTASLSETDRGIYEGFYTVRPGDDFNFPSYTARLEKRGRVGEAFSVTENRDRGYDRGYDRAQDHNRGYNQPAAPTCNNCGVISSIKEVDEGSNEANVPGLLIGGLLGGAVGNQFGQGSGRDVSTLLGAIVGGTVGNQVGKDQNRHRIWIITVNLDNGTSQTFKNEQPPQASAGQRVRVENNQLVLDRR